MAGSDPARPLPNYSRIKRAVRMNREMDIDNLREDLTRADRRMRAVVRERPFAALGTAIAAGFLLGRAMRGR